MWNLKSRNQDFSSIGKELDMNGTIQRLENLTEDQALNIIIDDYKNNSKAITFIEGNTLETMIGRLSKNKERLPNIVYNENLSDIVQMVNFENETHLISKIIKKLTSDKK